MPKFVIVRESGIPENAGKRVRTNGRHIAIFKVNGQVFAIDDACPCGGASLSAGTVENNQVECPLHGYLFDLESGSAVLPPRFEGVTIYPVHVSNGQIEIELDRPNAPPSSPEPCQSRHCTGSCRRKPPLKPVEPKSVSSAAPLASQCVKSNSLAEICGEETGSTL